MFFQHVYDKSLAQASYVIACQANGIAAVIDPKRDVDTYLRIAEENNFKITHIFETHIHADFLSGSRELAALTGADMYLSDEGDENWKYNFPHKGLKHGDVIKLGKVHFEVLHTPGHTPEHISFLLRDTAATHAPAMLFTGDFVFVGDVGRPDLLDAAAGMTGTKEIGAEQMFHSLQRFATMDDFIQLWPGHGAGSACGKALGAVPMSTVGYEKIRNWALQLLNDRKEFTDQLLEGQPEPPRYFAMMKKLNKEPRKLVTEVPKVPNLDKAAWEKVKADQLPIIDTRHPEDYARFFLKGTLNIMNNNSFATWMGWYMDYDQDFVFIAEEKDIDELTRKVMRIGLDNLKGFITPAQLQEFEKGGLLNHTPADKKDVKAAVDDDSTVILDVRGQSEYDEYHIPGAKHLFVGTLPKHLDEVPKDKEVILQCQSGARSSLAYSVLRAHGFDNVRNYGGGMNDWQA
jgi:hydroxyacylglutathione hydrolase